MQLACQLLSLCLLDLAQADGQRTELAALLANGAEKQRVFDRNGCNRGKGLSHTQLGQFKTPRHGIDELQYAKDIAFRNKRHTQYSTVGQAGQLIDCSTMTLVDLRIVHQ